MVFVCNLQSIHSLANVVKLFAIKTCQPCHIKLQPCYIKLQPCYILNQLLAFTRASATRIKSRVSGLLWQNMHSWTYDPRR